MGQYNILSKDELSTLTEAIPGEIATTDDGEVFILAEGDEWKQMIDLPQSQLTLYDLNKQLMKTYPIMSEEQINEAKSEVLEKFLELTNSQNYYMLLSNDLRYYTVFDRSYGNFIPRFVDEVINCLQDLGQIQAIDLNDDNVVEAWVKLDNEESEILYLFPYDQGVIKCR